MIRSLILTVLLSLVSYSALAGGLGTSLQRQYFPDMACVAADDCEALLNLPQTVKVMCPKTGVHAGTCGVMWAQCTRSSDHVGVFNPLTSLCDFFPVYPDGVVCHSDWDCPQGGGVSQYGDALVSTGTSCHFVPGSYLGVCGAKVTDVQCCTSGVDTWLMCKPDPKSCVSNADCYADGKTCYQGTCQTPNQSQMLGDGNVCDSDADCISSVWGLQCIPSAYAPATGALCQECLQDDSDLDGVDDGCTYDRPVCIWGFFTEDGQERSYYQCQESYS